MQGVWKYQVRIKEACSGVADSRFAKLHLASHSSHLASSDRLVRWSSLVLEVEKSV